MGRIVDRAETLALALGAPGLFLAALLDSSALSLPEVVDILVIVMIARHHARFPLYVLAATAGSMIGCVMLYYVGLKGGEALVRRRLATHTIERVRAVFERRGVLAVVIASLLPPPMPFKAFVLLAGGADIGIVRFITAIAIGRGARFGALGILAVEYGDPAIAYLREHGVAASLAAVGVIVAGSAAYLLWSKAQRAKGR